MKPWESLGRAIVPGGDAPMELFRRDAELAIRVGGHELMNSRQHGSEDALAELTCDRLGDRPAPRVLVGGLGMGFTLAAALRRLGPEATVVVAELVPEVVAWNEGVVGEVAGRPLQDPRVRVEVCDVGWRLRHAQAEFDAVLLDVDNGPEGFTREANDWLYGTSGLATLHEALRPDGIVSIWSSTKNATFVRRLSRSGFAVEEVGLRARGTKGARHVVWIARRR